MNKFIFDVDGTLTPSRQHIDKDFKKFFLDFCGSNDVFLVTGSDYAKTLEQLGEEICHKVKVIYNCSGNDVWSLGVNLYSKEWKVPQELDSLFNGWLQASSFPLRTGNHIEHRPGCANFSIVGRNCTLGERKLYIKHDLDNRERESIAHQINSDFKDITASVGGETGIDIYPTGWDKGQIIHEFNSFDKLYFFGDKTEPGGNDEPLAKLIKQTFQVKDWQDTYERLQYFQEAKVAA
tara:strand:- start:1150 stop:1857 length:708 start_codon:yes stop_codon:yes gene_type:complete